MSMVYDCSGSIDSWIERESFFRDCAVYNLSHSCNSIVADNKIKIENKTNEAYYYKMCIHVMFAECC